MRKLAAALTLFVAGSSCKPDLGADDSLIASPRILAAPGEPPETRPGASASYRVLVADPSDTSAASHVTWRWCTAPDPPSNNDVASSACLEDSSLVAAGGGATPTATTPRDACALFGPDTPPGGFRPPDADSTGGYYQPLRLDLAGASPAFALARIRCDLAQAPADVAQAFATRYVPNTNPHLQPLVGRVGGQLVSWDAVMAGASVDVQARWLASDVESFVAFDPSSQTLETQVESLRVAWYGITGGFASVETGAASDDPSGTTSDNTWMAPSAGDGHLWVVLRDDRGGSDFVDQPFHIVR